MADFNKVLQKNNPVWNTQTRQVENTFSGTTVMLNDGSNNIRPDTNYMILYNSGVNTVTLAQMVSDGSGSFTIVNGIVVVPGASFEIAVDYGTLNPLNKRLGEGVGIVATGTNGQKFTCTYFTS
jgi:hypothetical protein